jgi:prolyl oligopeptidase
MTNLQNRRKSTCPGSRLPSKLGWVTVFLLSSVAGAADAQDRPVYPPTRKVDVIDTYFGTRVPDPYRWLEEDTSSSVAKWVETQNRVTFRYLEGIPFRAALRNRLQQLYNYPRYGFPYCHKGYVIFSKNDGLQNQDVLFVQKGMEGEPEVLLDPNTFSHDGRSKLVAVSYSSDMKYLAYAVSEGGADWVTLQVMELATRKVLPERLRWTKFGGASWKGHGFYYVRFDVPADTARALTAVSDNSKIYFHRVGTSQAEDKLVYADPAHPKRPKRVALTDDERFEILYVEEPGNNGNALSVRDGARGDSTFHAIVESFDDEYGVLDDHIGGKLLVRTNRKAPNGKVVLIDPERPAPEHWVEIIPEKEYPMAYAVTVGSKIFAVYLRDVATKVQVYNFNGKFEREVPLPALGTAGGFGGWREDSTVFYSFSSFTYPPAIYEYNLRNGGSQLFRKAEVPFNPADYRTEQVFFPSKDGTRIPMFLVSKKGLERNGMNPVLMYGYGGFNSALGPGFDPLRIVLLEQGFVYASVNLRGGSEYGERWHEAGMRLNKQNVFDDFIAAAEWLVRERYTSPEMLAMSGGSNGGLLVGAVMTQRPDLFKVALPAVGVMDMLRFQKFTVGYGWVTDYGSSDDSTQFTAIYRYSPLHNIRAGVAYPATLATTADHDDRVVPSHSFKFIATLQEKQAGTAPVLIRIETRSGHGASSTAVRLDVTADTYAFLMYNLGLTPRY